MGKEVAKTMWKFGVDSLAFAFLSVVTWGVFIFGSFLMTLFLWERCIYGKKQCRYLDLVLGIFLVAIVVVLTRLMNS